MDKGWDLTLDSTSFSNLFPDKTSSNTKQQQQLDMFQFSVCSSTGEDCHGIISSSSPSSYENRRVAVDEVDFFSDYVGDKKKINALTVVNVKERFHGESGPGSALDVNVSVLFNGLILLLVPIIYKFCGTITSGIETHECREPEAKRHGYYC
ncbi:uncharacterized protein LOC120147105 [Hibiscus syriacus]|uniref:uncharacterized protein LOC120147105 n=1 Tax=Hibiscus syriacus TaxID=106335 RepID=UPI001923464A|nr:uncharacterized protein LOC120147105 [Hibiscus syriacus]